MSVLFAKEVATCGTSFGFVVHFPVDIFKNCLRRGRVAVDSELRGRVSFVFCSLIDGIRFAFREHSFIKRLIGS